ncbi:MAG: hypothetical protein LBU14_02435 [Candidatus Peribacteria bacterium]|nr:hypothetical protein [Candidatus Peribacteria bacterium]
MLITGTTQSSQVIFSLMEFTNFSVKILVEVALSLLEPYHPPAEIVKRLVHISSILSTIC